MALIPKDTLKQLIHLAAELDDFGLYSEATEIDQFVDEFSSEMRVDPRYQKVFSDVLELLSNMDVDASVLNAVQELQNKDYIIPAKPDIYVPEGTTPYFVPEEARNAALGYAQMYRSVEEIRQELADAIGDEEKTKLLRQELKADSESLEHFGRIMRQYEQQNKPLYDKLMEYINNALSGDPSSIKLFPDRRAEDRRTHE